MNALTVRAGRRRGAALLYTIFVSLAAAAMASLLMAVSSSADRRASTFRRTTQGRYLAEGAVEAGKLAVSTAMANWQPVPPGGTATIGGQAVNFTITPTGFNDVDTDPAGIQTILTGFQLAATARVDRGSVTSNRLINTRATPIFQFAVFYTTDLEINPGPDMTLGGRVHSNSDMYLNCGGTLTMNTNYVRAAGNIYRNRKDNASLSEGTVRIREYVLNPYDVSEPLSYFNMNSVSQMDALGVPNTSGYDSAFTSAHDANGDGFIDSPPNEWLPWSAGALDYWSEPDGYAHSGNTVQDAAHGISPAATPSIGSIQMYEPVENGSHYFDVGTGTYLEAAPGMGTHNPGYYHSEAGLVILTHDDGSFEAYTGAGLDVTATLVSAGVITSNPLFDARQANGAAGEIPCTNIDLKNLKDNAPGLWPANGLLYAAHYGAGTGLEAKGVRLVNGSTLAAPLTVVTENSLYIQGDYNTTAKKGASVIADAVNLLSKDWKDTKTVGTLPTAKATTYNVALITGNTETVGAAYNGGLENLPRFHENWNGINCNITGSFVNTWSSQYATGAWLYGGDRYTAPRRNWIYDTSFNLVANLPPFTPMAVSAEDVAVW
jgi:hypothetical protein